MNHSDRVVHGIGTPTEAVCKGATATNVRLQSLATTLRFAVETKGTMPVVTLVNHPTHEVFGQVRPQDLLAISRSLQRMQRVMATMRRDGQSS
jgi:uncharacterized FlaG/YvyC family protein